MYPSVQAQNGHVDAIRLLAENGANVNSPDKNGYTPVYIAAYKGHADAIRVLAENGANVNTLDKDGYTQCILRPKMVIPM